MNTKQEDLKPLLAAVIDDLHQAGTRNAEAMLLIGRLASDLANQIKAPGWAEAKRRMTRADYNTLLREFSAAGIAHHREGRIMPAYAVQALGVSLLAATDPSPEVKQGERLLDEVIDRAIIVYRRARKKSA